MSDEPNIEPTPNDPVVEPVVEPTEPQGETLITPPVEPDAKDSTGDKVGAPENYEDFILPDGVEMDEGARDTFLPIAKQLNLSQEEAQALVNYEATRVAEFTTAQDDAWSALNEEWAVATKSDKEIGGPAFDQSLANAKKFLNAYGTAELTEALDATGMGNHPEIIRAFARAGKAMGEDTLTLGNATQQERSAEDILYPNQSNI